MGIRKKYVLCKGCNVFVEVGDDGHCASCGRELSAKIQKLIDPVMFRPHYNYTFDRHVDSMRDMQKAADEMNRQYGYNIKMSRQ